MKNQLNHILRDQQTVKAEINNRQHIIHQVQHEKRIKVEN